MSFSQMQKAKSIGILLLVLVGILFICAIFTNNSGVPTKYADDSSKIGNQSYHIFKYPNSEYYKNTDSHLIYTSPNNGYSTTSVEADYDTFTLPFPSYSTRIAKDKYHIFVSGKIDNRVDPATFTFYKIGDEYDKFFGDKNGFYYLGQDKDYNDVLQPIPFDPRTIKIQGNFIRTKDKVYTFSYSAISEILGSDPETFHEVGTCYSVEMSGASFNADKNHVYVGSVVVPEMDPQTLVPVAKISSDAQSEIPYTIYLWKDKNHAYAYCGKIIQEADLASFKYIGNGIAEDINNYYKFNTGGGYTVTRKP